MTLFTRICPSPVTLKAACATFALAASLGMAREARAEVHLPAIESDNMILQSGTPQLYGTAAPGELVAVYYGRRHVSTRTAPNGRWKVTLNRVTGGETFDITVKGSNTLTIKNVLVGQVWLCSGQSNMEFPLQKARDHAAELAKLATDNKRLRLFHVKRQIASQPASAIEGQWQICNARTAAEFSAVGYYFGKELAIDLKQPVGLIESSWGGTPAQSWTSLDGLEGDPVTQKRYWLMAREHLIKVHAEAEAYDKAMAEWTETVRKAIIEKVPAEKDAVEKLAADEVEKKALEMKVAMPAPPGKSHDIDYPSTPGMLYNGMIAPLVGCSLAGVIWYQGESNANTADETMAYRRLFPVLITDWRSKFGQPLMPFLFVQLANFERHEDPNTRSPWAELREAQLMTARLPRTAMAVAIDVGEEKDIHPTNKQTVGHRLELAALATAYGHKVPYSGPIYSAMTVQDNKVICTFKHTDRGLKARGGGDKIVGFVICGADKKFVPAEAVIAGNTVVVSSPAVEHPVAVRYAWAGDPQNNLENGVGLPASPFRTDVAMEPQPVDLPVTK